MAVAGPLAAVLEVADLMTEVVYRPTGLVSDKPMTARMVGVKISALRRRRRLPLFPHRDNLQTRRECIRIEVFFMVALFVFLGGGISHLYSRLWPGIKLCINSVEP